MTITTKKIERLVAVDGKRVSLSVGDGLTIRVHPSGRKSWVFRLYRDGRVIDETIGHWPEMSLKHARRYAKSASVPPLNRLRASRSEMPSASGAP